MQVFCALRPSGPRLSFVITALSLGLFPSRTSGLSLAFDSVACFAACHPPGFLTAMRHIAPAAACPRGAVGVALMRWRPAGARALEMQAGGQKKDWRGSKGGRRGKGGGFRAPPALSEADLAEVQSLEGVQALLSEGMKVVVLAIGKARLFYEGNPVVFGGAVSAVFGEPAPGDIVTVTDHKGKQVGWGIYNPDSMYRVRMLWLNSIDGPAGSLRDVSATLAKRLASAGLSLPTLSSDVDLRPCPLCCLCPR